MEKTFFVYGGTTARVATDKQQLLHMVAYFDHKTGLVPRPRLLLNKQTTDAHDNPTLQVDDAGHLWIFSSSHGTSRPSYIHRSTKPWSIDEFEQIAVTNFSYTQPWHVPGRGFLFLHTRYGGGKNQGITPLVAALRQEQLEEAADVLTRATVGGQVAAAVLHVTQRETTFTRTFGKAQSEQAMFLLLLRDWPRQILRGAGCDSV